jgi:hypothetical protein
MVHLFISSYILKAMVLRSNEKTFSLLIIRNLPPTCNGQSSVKGLHGIRRRRVSAGFNSTKSTASGTSIT